MDDQSQIINPGIFSAEDISCLIIPDGCVGLPTLAAMEHGIPVIAVKENKNRMQNNLADFPFEKGKFFVADNYLEAAGIMNAIKSGIAPESVRRPLKYTPEIEFKYSKPSATPERSLSAINSSSDPEDRSSIIKLG